MGTEACTPPDFPAKQCPCGAGACIVLVSKRKKNPGRKFYKCPAFSVTGQRACNFFQWQDDLGKTISDGNLDQNKGVISPPLISDSHGDTETIDCATDNRSDCNKLEGSPSLGLAERDTMLQRECLVNEENVEFVSKANEAHLPPIRSLSLFEDGRYKAGSKPGKCFHCGREGHWIWMKECTGSPNSPCFTCGKIGHWMKECTGSPNSPCFKCGKIGHWMKDCSVARRCNFSKLCDTVTYDQRCPTPKSSDPMCSCGAGICNLLMEKNGVNEGQKFFVCPVKKGQGACNFLRWQDDLGNTVDNGKLDQNRSAISPPLISNSHGDTETTDCTTDKKSECNKLEGPSSPGLAERDTMLPREHLINEENAGFVSGNNETHFHQSEVSLGISNGNLDQNKGVISPPLISDSHGDTETTDCATDKRSDCNKPEGSSSPGLAEGDTMLQRECLVNEENVEFVSKANEAHLPPIRRLSLIEDGRYEAGSKPGKCFLCGKEGHWKKECTGSPSSP